MKTGILRGGRALLLTLALTGVSKANVLDWSMTLTPQSAVTEPNTMIDFHITFVNDSAQDLFFSDFGDGQSITVDLEGNVVGSGACGPGVDCFVQNLFLTSADPIDIAAGSTGTTFDLGDLILGNHIGGGLITVVAKGGPDSDNGVFANPAFAETTSQVTMIPEPPSITLMMTGLFVIAIASRFAAWRCSRS